MTQENIVTSGKGWAATAEFLRIRKQAVLQVVIIDSNDNSSNRVEIPVSALKNLDLSQFQGEDDEEPNSPQEGSSGLTIG